MNYELPTSVEIEGKDYKIRSDYRAILDIITALNDADLSEQERAGVALFIFYEEIPENAEKAIEELFLFMNLGEKDDGRDRPKLMDWEQDFKLIVSPINKVVGSEIRALPYLHWWTFISAYNEIGESTFSTVVSIRQKRIKSKKLDKWEQDFYRDNREMIDIKPKLSAEEQKILDSFNL